MKACVLKEIGQLVYKEVGDVLPQQGEVLLKIKACGICSSDISRVFKTGTYHFPTIPGHEFSGEIVSVGNGVSNDYIGKRAVVFPILPCGECENCKQEQYARCDNYNYFGSRCDGGFAEYIVVPLWNLVFFENLDFKTAALCEPAAVALHSVKTAEIRKCEKVLIIGTGTIGILASHWARKFSSSIAIAGRTKSKLEFVKKFESIDVVNTYVDKIENLFDIVIECVGTNESISYAVNSVKKGGKLILTGNPASNILFRKDEYWKILRKEITLKGTWNSFYGKDNNDWRDTINYLRYEEKHLQKLITHVFKLSEYDKAFKTLSDNKKMTIKVMFVMEE